MVKIALFGSAETTQLVSSLASEVEGIQLETYCYQDVSDVETLLPQSKEADVYLFSGILPYRHAECLLGDFKKPAVYIEDNELNVSLTLLHVVTKNICALDRLSIDLPDREYLDSIVRQLQLQPAPGYVKDFAWLKTTKCPQFETGHLFQFHRELWDEGKTELAVTSIHAVYDQLSDQGIPCLRLMDAEKTMKDALLRAKEVGVLQQTQLAQVAVCMIEVDGDAEGGIPLRGMEPISEALQTIARQVNGNIQQTGPASFEYYGTKGSIQFLLDQHALLQSAKKLADEMAVTIQAGAGFGMTITEAKKNAAIALSSCPENRHSIILVTEENEVIDPLVRQRIQTLSTTDSHVRYLANTARVSVPNLMKMQQFLKARSGSHFTSDDIAAYFQLTKRSAERMLKKYMDAGWLRIVGEEQPHRNGRPRAIYLLEFPSSE